MAASLIKNKAAFGRYLERCLKEGEIERKTLANRSGISTAFLSRVIRGQKGVDWETLERIASALSISVETLLNESQALGETQVSPSPAAPAASLEARIYVWLPCQFCGKRIPVSTERGSFVKEVPCPFCLALNETNLNLTDLRRYQKKYDSEMRRLAKDLFSSAPSEVGS